MEDAKVLNPTARAAGFYGLMSLSALSALGACWLSFAPPVLRDARTEAAITESLQRGESYQGAARVGWAKALSLGLTGIAASSGYGAVMLSSSRPKTLSTSLLDDVASPHTLTTLKTISDKQYADQGQIVTDKITAMFDEHPWLEDVVDVEGSLMDMLIIIGQPGKGKSCLASSIALLRKVMHFTPIYIFDADADKNVKKGTWVSGQVAGLTEESPLAGDYNNLDYRQQHDRMQAAVIEELKTEAAVTVIYDEEQRLSPNGFDAAAIQKHYEDYTAYRKRGDKVIHLWHAATKSGSGLAHLPKDSALLIELLAYATVIDFNAAPEPPVGHRRRKSKEKNSDRAMYKPAGAKYTTANMELITIPKLLHPLTLVDLLGSAAEYFDVRLSGFRDPGLAQRRAAIRKKVRGRLMGTNQDGEGNFKSSLEKLFSDPLTQHYLENKGAQSAADVEDGMSLEGVPDRELFIELLKYLEHPNRVTAAGDDGFYSIRDIYRRWGCKEKGGTKRFSSADAMRTFLDVCNAQGLGEWRDDSRGDWRGRYETADFE